MLKLNKIEAIQKLNQAGKSSEPFFVLIDFSGEHFEFWTQQELDNQKILIDFPNFRNISEDYQEHINTQIQLINQLEIKAYEQAFNRIQEALQRGDTYLCNLTFAQEIDISSKLVDIFYQATAKYKIYYPDFFLCFSPEIFIKTQANQIFTHPMKGTFEEEDQQGLTNDKEIAEHATVVDLLRNDLSLVASNVRVEKYRYLEKIQTSSGKCYFQTSSKICGELPAKWQENLGGILTSLLPAGSVTGAPKKKTLELILEVEQYQRNFYTGVAVYFNGQELDSCVLIRFIEQKDNNFIFKSGGGITSDSMMVEEYQELISKIYVPVSGKY